jgi:salicylate hydroxylase
MTSENSPFQIAIIGGGLTGLQLALGLLRRGIAVTVYEQYTERREVGAGISIYKSFLEALELLNPDILQGLLGISVSSGGEFFLRNGPHAARPKDQDYDVKVGDTVAGKSCLRAHYLGVLDKLLPEGVLKFGKQLETIKEDAGGKVTLRFTNGTEAQADAVIGTDGIKSRVRANLLGSDHPSAMATYSGCSVYRAMVPMQDAIRVLGAGRATRMLVEMGPSSSIVHYPVSATLMNIVASTWVANSSVSDEGKMTVSVTRQDMHQSYEAWGSDIHGLIDCVPDVVEVWRVFDSADHPLDSYTYGRVCLAGDAAHAMTHHM